MSVANPPASLQICLDVLHELLSYDPTDLANLVNTNPSLTATIETLLLLELGTRPTATRSDPASARMLLHHLIERVPPQFFTFPRLLFYTAIYQSENTDRVEAHLRKIFEANPQLSKTVLQGTASYFIDSLEKSRMDFKGKGKPGRELLPRALLFLSMMRSTPELSSACGSLRKVIEGLSKLYNQLLAECRPVTLVDRIAELRENRRSELSEEERRWMVAKLEVIETTYALLDVAFFSHLANDRLSEAQRSAYIAELCDLLSFEWFASKGSNEIHLFDQALLTDLEHYYKLSSRIITACGPNDERGRVLSRKFESVRSSGSLDALDLLRESSDAPGSEKDVTVDLSIMITEIQDLFPHLSTQFLQRAFAHPAYSSGSSSTSGYNKEKLLIDLLEDSLPVDLKRDQDRQNANVREVEIQDREKIVSKPQSQLLANRSIYQDRVGAKDVLLSAGLTPSTLLDSSIKASIISRAEMQSDEDDDDYREEEGEAFLEDFDDIGRSKTFRVGNDGEEDEDDGGSRLSSVANSGTTTPAISQRPTVIAPAVLSFLMSTYSATPEIFERTSIIRRSKERTKVREKTGLSNEAIEEWGLRWKREPNKDRVSNNLDLDTFVGNQQGETVVAGKARGGNSGRGGGGGAGGEGSRGRGGGARGRGRGDGKWISDRRQRGADRKMPKLA